MWAAWWVWGVAAVGLAIGEVLIPGFVLLGFARRGRRVVALILLVGGPLAVWLGRVVALVAAGLLGWCRWCPGWRCARWVGVYRGQVKTFDHDINDN